MILAYKTKNDVPPHGKSKVYFCCHPQDFPLYFEAISKEILTIESCSIWYCQDPNDVRDEEFYYDLSQMKLFVIPITSRFLNTANAALQDDFRFAVDHHIPILPLMQEKGLASRFNEVCGELQFLDKYAQDDTAISYDEKLSKYLCNMLIGEETTARILDTFRTQIFLSYRKKDRRYAQQLMHDIHKVDSCEDVAIWYDEFLIPGEDFNESIEAEIDNSDAFFLTVTPNLVNEENYVRTKEYPAAQKAALPIVPLEMLSTDKSLLREQYRNIPTCISPKNADVFQETVLHTLSLDTYPPKYSGPERDFLIGLAYLNGIHTEVDVPRALSLITSSAEADHWEAIEQLISMYLHGNGIPRNIHRSVEWREKLAALAQKIYLREHTINSLLDYIKCCSDLGEAYVAVSQYDKADEQFHIVNELYETAMDLFNCDSDQKLTLHFYRCVSLFGMAQNAYNRGRLDKQEQYLQQAIDLCEQVNERVDNLYFKRCLSLLYRETSKLWKSRNNIPQAIHYAEKAVQAHEVYALTSDEIYFRFDLLQTFHNLSELYRISGQHEKAITCSHRAVEGLEQLLTNEKNCALLEWKGLLYLGLSESYRTASKLDEAIRYNRIAENTLQELHTVFGEYQWLTKYLCLFRKAQIYLALGRYDDVLRYASEALRIQELHNVIDNNQRLTGDTSLLTLRYLLTQAYLAYGNMQEAYLCAKQAVVLADESIADGIPLCYTECVMIYALYGSLIIESEQFDSAKEYLNKVITLCHTFQLPTDTLIMRCVFMLVWTSLGRIASFEDDSAAALEYFQRSEKLYELIADNFAHDTPILQRDYQILQFNKGFSQLDDNPSLAIPCLEKVVSLIETRPLNDRTATDWNQLGACYYVLAVSTGIFRKKRWEKKFYALLEDAMAHFGDDFCKTGLYTFLQSVGFYE